MSRIGPLTGRTAPGGADRGGSAAGQFTGEAVGASGLIFGNRWGYQIGLRRSGRENFCNLVNLSPQPCVLNM